MTKDSSFGKRLLSSFLGFLKDKVDNDLLTVDEEQALIRIIERDLPLSGTSDDFARYFNQSPGNVRSVINRRMMSKPKRRVMYDFLDFCRSAPRKWFTNT